MSVILGPLPGKRPVVRQEIRHEIDPYQYAAEDESEDTEGDTSDDEGDFSYAKPPSPKMRIKREKKQGKLLIFFIDFSMNQLFSFDLIKFNC
jgi:hypothetical protein